MIRPGAIVIVDLTNPTEKLWGVLHDLGVAGVTVRAINLSSFDDWMSQAARRDQTLGLSTLFVPLFRVERIFLDEPVGAVESYRERFAKRVGVSVEAYLGLETGPPEGDPERQKPPEIPS
jgi:hypothetical protein